MQRYQNIQRTIATERPEEDSSSQNCEQVPAGGGGGGGESDSDTESSQLSLGMGGGVPGLWDGVRWLCDRVCEPLAAWRCSLGERKQWDGCRSGQRRKRQGANRSFPQGTKEETGSHKESASTMAWGHEAGR